MEDFILNVLCLIVGAIIAHGIDEDRRLEDINHNLHYPYFNRRKRGRK